MAEPTFKYVYIKYLVKLFDSLYVRVNDLCAYLYLVLSLILSFIFMAPNFKTLLQTCPSQTTYEII